MRDEFYFILPPSAFILANRQWLNLRLSSPLQWRDRAGFAPDFPGALEQKNNYLDFPTLSSFFLLCGYEFFRPVRKGPMDEAHEDRRAQAYVVSTLSQVDRVNEVYGRFIAGLLEDEP
jgi:hypothetical protein